MGDTQKLTPDEQVRSAFEAYEGIDAPKKLLRVSGADDSFVVIDNGQSVRFL